MPQRLQISYGVKNDIALILGSLNKEQQKSGSRLVNLLSETHVYTVNTESYLFPYRIRKKSLI